jgi:hypothetical protein
MLIVLILFRLIMMILLLMSLDMVLMPMEPSVGSLFTGAPFEGPLRAICNLMLVPARAGLQAWT